MPPSSNFLYSLLFISSHLIPLQCASHVEKPADDVIKQTCQTCAHMSSYNLSYDFCSSSLATLPISHVTNVADLGVVALELALQNSTHTVSIISRMLDDTKAADPPCKICLESCLELYLGMSAILEDCIVEWLWMQYDFVHLWVSTLMQAPGVCEAGFGEKGVDSPLTMQNYSLSQLCGTVLCILDLITPGFKSQCSKLRSR